MNKTRIVISGAGPVGSVAAYYLASHGVQVTLLESGADCATDLRASTLHPPTLEMLDELGVTAHLHAHGLRAPVYQFRTRNTDDYYDFDMSELADLTRYPYRLQCEQHYLSRALVARIAAQPTAKIRFNHRLTWFEQDQEGVTVTAETPSGVERFRCDYLIGADGANSVVRKLLQIDFDGFTYPEKFLCLSTDRPLQNDLDHLRDVNYLSDSQEWAVLLRVPSLWRILVPAQAEDDAALLSDDKKNDVFGRLIGVTDAVKTRHRTIYRVHQRVAKSFRVGRAMIIGDAAHLNSPIGGLGMNSGIHDAFNLCRKLVAVYQGADAEILLDRFERQRRAVCHDFIQAQSIRNLDLMKQGQARGHQLRQAEMRRLQGDHEARRGYLINQAMFASLRYEESIQ